MDGIMSTKTTRTKRPPSRKKQASPSLTSLFSSVTKASASSSGSNSTITPKTFQRQRQTSQLAKAQPITSSPEGNAAVETPTKSKPPARPNVFAFMDAAAEDNDEAENSDSASQDGRNNSSNHRHSVMQALARPPVTPNPRRDDRRASTSLHSDSGISVNSTSPDLDKTPRALAHITDRQSSLEWPNSRSHSPDLRPDADASTTNSNTVGSIMQTRQIKRQTSSTDHRPRVLFSTGQYQSLPPDPAQSIPAVTDSRLKHLARHVTTRPGSSNPPPIYRRFEHLTNQLLIQLQTELTSIESEIAAIDASISKPSKAPIRRHPRLPTEELRWHRAQLLAAAGARLDAYHRLLASYDKLSHLSSASIDDIDLHRRFLHLPDVQVGQEFEYLDQLEDVIRVAGARTEGGPPNLAFADAQALAIGVAALMTILAFHSMPSLVARIALGGLVEGGMFAAGWLPRFQESDGRVEACLYGLTALVLAVAVA